MDAASSDSHVSLAVPNEIHTTRLLDAPRELVWQVFTQAEHVQHWWGPTGFSITTHEMDVRPGGTWRLTMHGPDGTDYPNNIDFTEVERPARLAWAHGADDGGAPWFRVIVTFEARGRQTLLTLKHIFPSAAARDENIAKVGSLEGAKQTTARLAAYLATM